MDSKRSFGVALALVPIGLFAPRFAAAQGYNYTSYDYAGAISTTLNSVNDSGVFAGSYTTYLSPTSSATGTFGFVDYRDGVTTQINGPGISAPFDTTTTYDSEVNRINNADVFVGDYEKTDPSGNTTVHGLIGAGIAPQTTSDDPDSAGVSEVTGINDTGETVGAYLGSDGNYHSYSENKGTFTSFDVTGYGTSSANAVNNAGTIVGTAATDVNTGPSVGYVESNGTFLILSIAGATDVYAEDINNFGEIAGTYDGYDSSNNFFEDGFVFDNGAFTSVAFTGALATEVDGINDDGEIVGTYLDSSGFQHGFFATPAPEPSQSAAFGLGILGLGGLALRAKKRRLNA